jgi:hypothetical protein
MLTFNASNSAEHASSAHLKRIHSESGSAPIDQDLIVAILTMSLYVILGRWPRVFMYRSAVGAVATTINAGCSGSFTNGGCRLIKNALRADSANEIPVLPAPADPK